MWQKGPSHICGKKTQSYCVSVCSCARARTNGRSATFQIIPHTGGSTLSLYTHGLARLTHHQALWSAPCVTVQTRCDRRLHLSVRHHLAKKKFCLETLHLQLLGASEANRKVQTAEHIKPKTLMH